MKEVCNITPSFREFVASRFKFYLHFRKSILKFCRQNDGCTGTCIAAKLAFRSDQSQGLLMPPVVSWNKASASGSDGESASSSWMRARAFCSHCILVVRNGTVDFGDPLLALALAEEEPRGGGVSHDVSCRIQAWKT
jgi:hypothetical protein